MKKIKLIAPILTLATISSCLVPLTSCKNKNDLGITKEQWNKAFELIKDPANSKRNFTVDGTISLIGSEILAQPFSVIAANQFMLGTWGEDEYYTKTIDDTIIWSCNETLIEPTPNYFGNGSSNLTPMIVAFYVCGQIFDYSYEVLSKVGDLQYKAQWLNVLDTLNGNCYFTFNSDFTVQKIVVDAYATIGTTDIPVIDATLNFKDYGNSKVPEDFDTKFDNIKNHVFEAKLDESKTKYVVEQPKSENSQFNFIMPEDLELNNLNTIKVTKGDYMNRYAIFLNGYQLVNEVDYIIEESEFGESSAPKKIKLNTPLKANDKLMVLGGSGYVGACLGLELKSE